jgi:hypothetical protein
VVETAPADEDIRGLDVAVHQTRPVRVLQRVTDLSQQMDRARCRHRAEPLDQRFQIEAVEHLHHVVERAVLRDAEVVELHRVRRAQSSGRLRLALEAAEHLAG